MNKKRVSNLTVITVISLFFAIILALDMSAVAQQRGGPIGQQLKEDKIDTEFIDKFVDVNGRKINARVYGNGNPTIVLLSGFMAPQSYWNSVIPELAELGTVLTYDRPGMGKSEIGDIPCHAKQAADDLNTLLENLDLPKPYIIVGHSYGCRVARLYSAYYPDDVAAILMEDGQHPGILEAQKKILTGEDKNQLEKMIARMKTPENPKTEMDFMEISMNQALNCPPMPEVHYTVLTSGDRTNAVPPFFSPEAKKKLIELGLEMQKEFVALVPGGKHIIVENSGHIIHQDKREVVIKEITELINKVRIEKDI